MSGITLQSRCCTKLHRLGLSGLARGNGSALLFAGIHVHATADATAVFATDLLTASLACSARVSNALALLIALLQRWKGPAKRSTLALGGSYALVGTLRRFSLFTSSSARTLGVALAVGGTNSHGSLDAFSDTSLCGAVFTDSHNLLGGNVLALGTTDGGGHLLTHFVARALFGHHCVATLRRAVVHGASLARLMADGTVSTCVAGASRVASGLGALVALCQTQTVGRILATLSALLRVGIAAFFATLSVVAVRCLTAFRAFGGLDILTVTLTRSHLRWSSGRTSTFTASSDASAHSLAFSLGLQSTLFGATLDFASTTHSAARRLSSLFSAL